MKRPLLALLLAAGAAHADSAVPGDGQRPAAALDRDGDGIPDAKDLCPDDPEDRDGFQDGDGCPDPDNDGDGIPDVADKCPNEPETMNGFQDEDGCPDKGVVKITTCSFPILDRIYFRAGSARIEPPSLPLLDAIAAALAGNPQIRRVELQGHGDRQEPARLAGARAEAVRAALIARGVAADRLQARGCGATRPLAGAREKNRRVEFVIVDRAD